MRTWNSQISGGMRTRYESSCKVNKVVQEELRQRVEREEEDDEETANMGEIYNKIAELQAKSDRGDRLSWEEAYTLHNLKIAFNA